jgi:hypothetical protein
MNSRRWVGVVGVAILLSQVARADDFLIRETEALRNTLSLSDPSRLPLTLRLADLCMEDAASADFSRKVKLQRQALALYEETLAKLEGNARLRVEFQKARILSDLGEIDRALPIWKKVADQREMTELAREAALKLAEAGDVARAAHWYSVALELCSGGDLCSYVRYKRAWLFKQASRTGLADDKAIQEIELALFDSKGQVREEALRDYLVFLGERGAQSSQDPALISAMKKVEALSQKLLRPHLIAELAEAYFAAGNKIAGTVVLAQAQRQNPQFVRLARLTEEQYGARDWDAFRLSLEDLSSAKTRLQLSSASDAEKLEGEKLLRRLVIQLDGERISQVDRKKDFQKATLVYLSLFPASPEKSKFQEGFLASENDAQTKLAQLDQWIALEPANIKLREFKASIAQKAGMNELVSAEMAKLAQLTGSREHRYVQARALYESKKYGEALPIFKELASVTTTPDQWAVQSQNLALDILAMNKTASGLSEVMTQASLWLDSTWAKGAISKSIAGELAEMTKIRDQARFEKAVLLGQSPEALAQFLGFCRAGFWMEKSCENARVLSVQLKDQKALLEVLALLGPSQQAVLASEFERAGQFGPAADLLEKQGGHKSDLQQALKLVLLRELSGDKAAWARSVRGMLIGKGSLTEAQEKLWLTMARDSGVLDMTSIKMVKSESAKALASEWLEQAGKGSGETRKLILSAKLMTGPTWKALVLADLDEKIAAQQKITFYGKNSKQQFEKRLKAVGIIATQADSRVAQADESTRVAIAAKMQGVYEGLAKEIRESPIPAGIPEEAIPELKAGLEEMAKPFEEKSKVYAAAVVPVSDTVQTQAAAPTGDESRVAGVLSRLSQDPDSPEVLSELRDLYRALKKERLASYFEGRLQAGRNP